MRSVSVGRCSACSPASRSCRRSNCCSRAGRRPGKPGTTRLERAERAAEPPLRLRDRRRRNAPRDPPEPGAASRQGRSSGYVLSFADIGPQIENLALRDAILRETMVEWRRPLANLRAAAETLFANPALKDADRTAFEEIIAKEVENLNDRFVEASRRYERLTAGPWPMSDIHSLDLFRVAAKASFRNRRHRADTGRHAALASGRQPFADTRARASDPRRDEATRANPPSTSRHCAGEKYAYVEVTWEGATDPFCGDQVLAR